MNILITGGAGFIGSNFIYYMLDKYPGYRLVCLDSLTYAGNLKTLNNAFEHPNFRFIRGDITDEQIVHKLFEEEDFDLIVNFAAESHVDRSIKNPKIFLNTNVTGTHILIDACLEFGVNRYHQISTDEVYGDLPLDSQDPPFTEDSHLRPSSPYSASKAAADLLTMAYHRTYGLQATISRCSNNYGPYHFPEKLIPLMITRAINNLSLPVYGRGKNIRDWLYVEDHCSAIDLIIHNGKPGEIYNIGSESEYTNLEVVEAILESLEKPHTLIKFVADRPGHDLRYAVNPGKIRTELGWIPAMDFKEGIKKTLKWYLDNQYWWEDILSGEYRRYNEKMFRFKETDPI